MYKKHLNVILLYSKMSCTVCVEPINKSTRKSIVCNFCSYMCCQLCAKTYLRDSYQLPHCMNCKKEWNKGFLNTNFTKVFLHSEYRASREIILFEEEKTYLPQFQEESKRTKIMRELDKEYHDIISKEIENEANEDQFVRQQRYKSRLFKLEKQSIIEKQGKLIQEGRSKKKDDIPFLKKCTVNECRGFLSKDYKCGLCNSSICKSCQCRLTDEHKCNQDDVKSLLELERSTKPCPKCYIPIQKSDGCDQMFCIQCHTGFSWKTGMIETGVIHNPHYFEMLQKGNIQDVRHRQEQGECGPIPLYTKIYTIVKNEPSNLRNAIQFYYQQFVHHRQVTLRMFEYRDTQEVRNDRISYLVGDLDENKYKANLYVRQQKQYRKQEERQIMDSFVTIGEELFRTLTIDNYNDILKQIQTLSIVTREAIVEIDKKYQHKGIIPPTMIIVYPV